MNTSQAIVFASGHKFAVVLAPEYSLDTYSTHRTEKQAIAASRIIGRRSHQIIDTTGRRYQVSGDQLVTH